MCRKFGGIVSSIDMFGHQIQLNYKGKPTNKTFFGGLLSLITYFLVIGYFALMLKEVQNNEATIKSTVMYKDFSKETFTFTQKDFDFAIQIRAEGYDARRFLEIKAFKTEYRYLIRNGQLRISMSPLDIFEGNCSFEDRILDEKKDLLPRKLSQNVLINQSGLEIPLQHQRILYANDMWYCPAEQFTLDLKLNFNEFQVDIVPCSGSDNCIQDPDTINAFLQKASIRIYKTSKYFDLNEFEDIPVKTVVDSEDFFFSTSNFKTLEYKISVNSAEGSQSKLAEQLDKFEYEFVQSDFNRESSQSFNPSQYAKIKFIISNEQKKVERINKNFVQVLSETGGIMGIVVSFFAVFGGSIQEFLFYSSIIGQIYLTEELVNNGEIQKHEDGQTEELNFEGGEADPEAAIDSMMNSQRSFKKRTNSNAKSFVFVEGDPNSYLGLIKLLQSRKPFSYIFKDSLLDFLRKFLFCCCKSKKIQIKKKLYEIAKEKIDKQLDISSLSKQILKKTRAIFYKNMLSNKLVKNLEKAELEESKEIQIEKRELELQQVAEHMIELFTDCKNNNRKSKKILENILGNQTHDEKPERNIQQKLFHGIMKKFLVKAMITHFNQNLSKNQKRSNHLQVQKQQQVEIDNTQAGKEFDNILKLQNEDIKTQFGPKSKGHDQKLNKSKKTEKYQWQKDLSLQDPFTKQMQILSKNHQKNLSYQSNKGYNELNQRHQQKISMPKEKQIEIELND
eukprot:403347842